MNEKSEVEGNDIGGLVLNEKSEVEGNVVGGLVLNEKSEVEGNDIGGFVLNEKSDGKLSRFGTEGFDDFRWGVLIVFKTRNVRFCLI